MHRSSVLALASCLCLAHAAAGDEIPVCSSCVYTSINAAINAAIDDASDGDVISLGAETYAPDLDSNSDSDSDSDLDLDLDLDWNLNWNLEPSCPSTRTPPRFYS